MTVEIREDVPLAPLTTFELGGNAECFAETATDTDLLEALGWARDRELPVTILGGGSNVVIADTGVAGLVLRVVPRGTSFGEDGIVTVCAGEVWDPFVSECVARDLAGLECLSGIPGLVGAAPIQNIGAYGQEVCETIERVRVLDRVDFGIRDLSAAQCGFAYRDSFLKQSLDRFVVLDVTFALRPGGAPAVRYAELARALDGTTSPSLSEVRDRVIALRRNKSMVIDPNDPNRRSAGSFFTNPIVAEASARAVARIAVEREQVSEESSVPSWPAGEGLTKLAAGWLIERSGIEKGLRRGNVGISSRHCLALVHHGGGTTEELLELARYVRDRVREAWGITLVPEPVLVGCAL